MKEIFARVHTTAVAVQDDAQACRGRRPIHRGVHGPIQGAHGFDHHNEVLLTSAWDDG
jgi:hypothetical protein